MSCVIVLFKFFEYLVIMGIVNVGILKLFLL